MGIPARPNSDEFAGAAQHQGKATSSNAALRDRQPGCRQPPAQAKTLPERNRRRGQENSAYMDKRVATLTGLGALSEFTWLWKSLPGRTPTNSPALHNIKAKQQAATLRPETDSTTTTGEGSIRAQAKTLHERSRRRSQENSAYMDKRVATLTGRGALSEFTWQWESLPGRTPTDSPALHNIKAKPQSATLRPETDSTASPGEDSLRLKRKRSMNEVEGEAGKTPHIWISE